MPKLSELLLTSQDTNPTPNDAIPTLKEVGGEATNKMAQLKDLPVSTAQQTALDGKMTGVGRIYIQSVAPTSPIEGDLWVDLS